jgi:EAL domain-containing protein (putative c-di-GMP-specific phosphodiesterase class I)
LLAQYGVNPRRIELEFTEGSLMTNGQVTLAELTALRAYGVRVALDDFGTGFANFSYITHLPADIIKIDKSFIFKICTDERSALVVRALIKIAHRLGYCVVAEGIENEMACQMLAAWQCDEGQGFYMSRPLPAERFTAVLHQDPRLHERITAEAADTGLSPLNRLQSEPANIQAVAGGAQMVKAT